MCIVSNIGDFYGRKWDMYPSQPVTIPQTIITTGVPREEFDALKREVENMKLLLLLAKKVDAANGTPDCEMDEKVAKLRAVAELVGIDLDEIFGSAVISENPT
jgi:hypothetical protein